jgi:hypothetical protein
MKIKKWFENTRPGSKRARAEAEHLGCGTGVGNS